MPRTRTLNVFTLAAHEPFARFDSPSFTAVLEEGARRQANYRPVVISDSHGCRWRVVSFDEYALVDCTGTGTCACADVGADRPWE